MMGSARPATFCTLVIPENRKLETENYPLRPAAPAVAPSGGHRTTYPLMTPRGFSLATFLAIPAPWTTSTTPETSL
jgi:hypothetical protein